MGHGSHLKGNTLKDCEARDEKVVEVCDAKVWTVYVLSADKGQLSGNALTGEPLPTRTVLDQLA